MFSNGYIFSVNAGEVKWWNLASLNLGMQNDAKLWNKPDTLTLISLAEKCPLIFKIQNMEKANYAGEGHI